MRKDDFRLTEEYKYVARTLVIKAAKAESLRAINKAFSDPLKTLPNVIAQVVHGSVKVYETCITIECRGKRRRVYFHHLPGYAAIREQVKKERLDFFENFSSYQNKQTILFNKALSTLWTARIKKYLLK